MKIVYFDYSAFALLAMLLLIALFRQVSRANGNRAFLVVVTEILLTTVMDIGAVLLDNAGMGNAGWKWFFHGGYLLFHTLTAFFYLIYLISLTDSWQHFMKEKANLAILVSPALLYFAALLTGHLFNCRVFYINEAQVYVRGEIFLLGYVVAAFYLLYGLFYIIRYRKLFTVNWIITLFSPTVLVAIAMFIEFFYPRFVIELFFNALGCLLIYANIQRPEEVLDLGTRLENSDAFENYVRKIYFNQKQVYCVMVTIRNYNSVRNLLDYESRNGFERGVGQRLTDIAEKLNLKARLFYAHQGRFFVFVDENHVAGLPEAAELICNSLNKARTISGIEVRPQTAVCVLKLPDDISYPADFLRFANRDTSTPVGEVVYAKVFLKDNYHKILLNIDRIVADAIDKGNLEVFYQPIYSVRDKRFISAEALARLKDPEFGYISPSIFIPAAEQSGDINRIWDAVIDSVCRFIAGDEFKGLGLDYIEVNLSAIQCMQGKLADQILQTINSYGIDRSQISLEITETALVYNTQVLTANMRKLSDSGMLICLDDYGTGYSDTRRIVDLPLNIVKLDMGFIQGIENPRISMIVHNTIRMLKELGVRVVAEGVETKEALECLEACECDDIQGFYFSKPLPKDDFVQMILGNK